MNKSSKCKNCRWNGKPYWSIINPCDNCYNEENNDFVYTSAQQLITQIVSEQDKETIKAIERYCEENDIIPNIIVKEKLDLVLRLGIQALNELELKESSNNEG